MYMKTKFFSFFLLAGSLLGGCDQDTPTQTLPTIVVPDVQQLSQTVYADAVAGKNEVAFTTNGAWTSEIREPVSAEATRAATDWVSISPASGDKAGSYSIRISLAANFTGQQRRAAIDLKCSGQTVTIHVTQQATTEDGEKPDVPEPVTAIRVSLQTLSLKPGQTAQLNAVVYPDHASVKEVNWTSSNPQVAGVDPKGTVIAVAEGTAEIVVCSVAYPDITATCIVTVEKEDSPSVTIPAHYVKGINGVDLVFDPQAACVIGNKSELFAERYAIEGGSLGGGGPVRSIKGQGREMRFPTEHVYAYDGGYLQQIDYLVGTRDEFDASIGQIVCTWDAGTLTRMRKVDNKTSGAISIAFEYGDLEQPEGNVDINLYAAFRDYQLLGPHYYVIFDNNLGERSKFLVRKVTVSKDDDPAYGGNYERTFRYVFYNDLVKEIYYTETKNGITKEEAKLCDFYYR